MSQQLSLSARPRSLDAMVGQDKLIARIRKHVASGRTVKAWLFSGPTGTGKTTIARIMALSLQCAHQKAFGSPCKECREAREQFDIFEINAAKNSGIRELESALDGAEYAPRMGQYRVYIVDEVHRSSEQAQSLIFKYLEDTPESTVFILCTAVAHKVNQMIQGRCMVYRLRELDYDGVTALVTKLLQKIESKLPVDRLAEALVDKGITLPRHIAQAVEKYAAGSAPEEAAEVEASASIDTKALTRALIKGEWQDVAKFLKEAQPGDLDGIRLGCLAYMRTILLDSPEIEERTKAVAQAIHILCDLRNTEDTVVSAGLAAALYNVCVVYSKFKR